MAGGRPIEETLKFLDADVVIQKLQEQISQQAREIAIRDVQIDILKEELRNKNLMLELE